MKKNPLLKSKWANVALFILLALLWSGSFINIKIVVDVFPPIFCALIRVLMSLMCLSLLFAIMRKNAFARPKNGWRL